MRLIAAGLAAGALSFSLSLGVLPAAAKPSAQLTHCRESAHKERLTGAKRRSFIATCLKGPLTTTAPTKPTEPNKESQAITKPSGVDRNVRAKQCDEEAARKKLSGQERQAFHKSCLATAGPVSEGETGTKLPHPANAIKSIGENNYKRSDTTAKSKPQP